MTIYNFQNINNKEINKQLAFRFAGKGIFNKSRFGIYRLTYKYARFVEYKRLKRIELIKNIVAGVVLTPILWGVLVFLFCLY